MSESALTTTQVLRSLQDAGYRITSARRAVVDAVIGRERHFTCADIVAKVVDGNRSAGRATVFRTLETLEELGVIDRIHDPEGGQRGYVVCPRDHHHHAICSRCGLVVDLPGCALSLDAGKHARVAGFHLQSHRVEYYGVCRDCQQGAAAG